MGEENGFYLKSYLEYFWLFSRKRHVCWEWRFKKLNFGSGILRSRIHRWNPVLNVLALGGSMWYFTLRICLGLHLGVHLGCSWGDNYGLYIYRWQCPTSIQSLFCTPWYYKYRSLCLRRRNHIYLKIFLLLDLQSIFTVTYVDTNRTIVIFIISVDSFIHSFNRTSFETFNMQTITRHYKKHTWEAYMFQDLKDVTVWNPACEISGL